MKCPQCGESAHRVKRTWFDRMVSFFKPVKRYKCDICDWEHSVLSPNNKSPADKK